MEKLKNLLSIEVLKKSDNLVEITGTIPALLIEEKRQLIIDKQSKDMKMDGFRKGHVPQEEVEKRLDEMQIWNEGAGMVIQDVFPSIIDEYDLTPLGPPSLSFTKVGIQTDVEFKLSVTILPKIILPDYEKIAREVKPMEDVSVEQSDIDTAILDLRKGLYMRDNPDKNLPKDVKKLPEVTDEIIKSLSPSCSDIKSFEIYLKDAIQKQKTEQAVTERRQKILDMILDETDINIPSVLIEPEVQSLWEKMNADLEKMNSSIEDHLKKISKTEDELKRLIREDSLKRAKVQLILNEIAQDQKIAPNQDTVDSELKRFKEKNTENISDEQIMVWLTTILANEEVLVYLEKLGIPSKNDV